MARLVKLFESDSTEWATPASIFDPLNEEFSFTLDVAASAENAKCTKYFTAAMDGLRHPWNGRCWCNPPYGRFIGDWMKKASLEQTRGVLTVALIPARTNTRWFHEYCFRNGEVRFVRGRHKFGEAKHGLPWPLAIVVFRATQPRRRDDERTAVNPLCIDYEKSAIVQLELNLPAG